MAVKLNYLDLFSGIGGFHKGFEEAGFKFKWSGHSEIDKYAKSIYQKHFPLSEDLGDVSNINVSELPEIDLITFGFPCQDVSVAGKRGGLQASRSGLFYQATKIIKAKRPSYFIFENVKGLFSSNGGLDWLNVLRAIADIGYDGQWQLLNTRWFLPQNRERVYFVGYPRGSSRQQIFPIGDGVGEIQQEGDGEDIAGCLSTRSGSGQANFDGSTTLIYSNSGVGRKLEERNIVPPLRANTSAGYNDYVEVKPVLTPNRTEKRQNGRRIKEDGEPMFTLTSQDQHGVSIIQRGGGFNTGGEKDICPTISTSSFEHNNHVDGIRRLTPVECERLQGFPDGWTAKGKDGEIISDTQRYKTLGNAVSVPVVKAVAKRTMA